MTALAFLAGIACGLAAAWGYRRREVRRLVGALKSAERELVEVLQRDRKG